MRELDRIRSLMAEPRTGIRFIFSPFIQRDALEAVLDGLPEAPTMIVTRWQELDLATGVSDPEAYESARSRGFKFKTHPRLHLKVYTWNLTDAIVGSANITRRGLGLSQPNEEYLTEVQRIPPERRLQLQRIVHEADLVTDETYEAVRHWARANRIASRAFPPLTKGRVPDRDFLTSALPMSDSPLEVVEDLHLWGTSKWDLIPSVRQECAIHDFVSYGGGVKRCESLTLDILREEFFEHPFVKALSDELRPCLHFGEIKAWIQQNCTDVPVPSRRDLTGKVQVLMRWFVELAPEAYTVDVPGQFSERLCRPF